MNCKFCGNFVPEGKDSCPVCGRRPEEEPIGKLLSDNMAAAEGDSADTAKAEENAKAKKTGLFAPLAMIIVSVGTWLAGVSQNALQWVQRALNSIGLGADSSYEVAADPKEEMIAMAVLGIAAVVSVLGVWGVILLIKRLVNRMTSPKTKKD